MLTVYQYPKCSTCRKALKWLEGKGVEFKSIDITLKPPSVAELKRAMSLSGKPLNKLFNTSGEAYREGNYKARLETMSEAEALKELSKNGKLIKRPLVLGADTALIGFAEAEYASRLG
jgi:arsenate reductase